MSPLSTHLKEMDKKNNNNDSLLQKLRAVLDPMCAGYIAGSCGIIVGHPLDSMKVLLQTQPHTGMNTATSNTNSMALSNVLSPNTTSRTLSSVAHHPTTTAMAAANDTYNAPKRSLKSLYAGVSGPMLTIGIVQSVNFALYDSFRRYLHYNNTSSENKNNSDYLYNDSLSNVAIASTLAGGVISFGTSPLMVVKTKQQVMLWSMKKAARDTLIHPGGFRNFYAGFGAHFICDAFGRGVYFTSYEYFKRKVRERNHSYNYSPNHIDTTTTINNNDNISLTHRMACAAISGMVCWTVIFPFDVIRSKTYAQAALLPKSRPLSSYQLASDIWRRGGIQHFFRGFGITVLRAGPVAAVVLPVYDIALDWLSHE